MIAYIIRSAISLLFLYGLYYFILRRQKLFVFTRFYLLFALVFSLLLPLISIPVSFSAGNEPAAVVASVNNYLPEISLPQPASVHQQNEATAGDRGFKITSAQWLLIIYILGVLLLLTRFIISINTIQRQKHLAEKSNFKGRRLALLDYPVNPFCFFNTIFVSMEDYLNGRIDDTLLNHELGHIKQLHSADIVFVELIQVFYWFNPILILYNRSIRLNHEFLADRNAINYIGDLKNYSDKLLSFIDYKKNLKLTSGFNHSQTRKRLTMITNSRRGKLNSGIRIASVLSLTAAIFITLSCRQSKSQSPEMIFIPAGHFTMAYLTMGTDTLRNATVSVDAFLMSNEITNREYREFTGWCKDHPGETLYDVRYRTSEGYDSISGKRWKTNVPLIRAIVVSSITDSLIDAEALPGIDKKYSNYFTSKKFDDYPVTGVSRKMAGYYCIWKTQMEQKEIVVNGQKIMSSSSHNYRLPLETEWEYAAQQAYEKTEAASRTLEKSDAGNKNTLGLTHLNDNVAEWVAATNDNRGVIRGGSWNNKLDYHSRVVTDPDCRDAMTGFRIVQSYMPVPKPVPGDSQDKP